MQREFFKVTGMLFPIYFQLAFSCSLCPNTLFVHCNMTKTGAVAGGRIFAKGGNVGMIKKVETINQDSFHSGRRLPGMQWRP